MPAEDQGYLISATMLPDGATATRTANTLEGSATGRGENDPPIDHVFALPAST